MGPFTSEVSPKPTPQVQPTRVLSLDGENPVVGASVRGRRHRIDGTERQDDIAMDSCSSWTALVAADGVGSQPFSALGAKAAAGLAPAVFTYYADERSMNPAKAARVSLRFAKNAVMALSEDLGVPTVQLASTLVLAGVRARKDATDLVVSYAGDGAVLAWQDSFRPVGLVLASATTPDSVVPLAETTREHRCHHTFHQVLPGTGWRVAVMTDGVSDDWAGSFRLLASWLEYTRHSSEDLLEFLNYRKRGSSDDRSIVVMGPRRKP